MMNDEVPGDHMKDFCFGLIYINAINVNIFTFQ